MIGGRKMKRFACFILLLISLQVKAQLMIDSLLINGNYRSFYFYAPSKKIVNGSLMFIMHGSGGTGKQIIQHTRELEAMAGGDNLIIVYPNGYKNYWNECCY